MLSGALGAELAAAGLVAGKKVGTDAGAFAPAALLSVLVGARGAACMLKFCVVVPNGDEEKDAFWLAGAANEKDGDADGGLLICLPPKALPGLNDGAAAERLEGCGAVCNDADDWDGGAERVEAEKEDCG